jgi:UDP-N-acetylglucosamine kinase
MSNVELEHDAVLWIRRSANKRLLISKFASLEDHPSPKYPVIAFMAGSPGAGKSEFVKDFKKSLEEVVGSPPVIIDPDAIREMLPGYTGANSYVFQRPISIAVDDLFHSVLKNRQVAIVDSTLSDFTRAKQNIDRVLAQYSGVFISYIFQHPVIAWHFTQLREVIEGRNIRKADFIDRFLGAKLTVDEIKQEFVDKVQLSLILKDYKDTKHNKAVAKVYNNVNSVEECINFPYTKESLERLLQ